MDSERIKRIRIAVAVAINGQWVANGSSATGAMTDDETDTANAYKAVRQLRALDVNSSYRINLVEADVILPILENKEVVVQAIETGKKVAVRTNE